MRLQVAVLVPDIACCVFTGKIENYPTKTTYLFICHLALCAL